MLSKRCACRHRNLSLKPHGLHRRPSLTPTQSLEHNQRQSSPTGRLRTGVGLCRVPPSGIRKNKGFPSGSRRHARGFLPCPIATCTTPPPRSAGSPRRKRPGSSRRRRPSPPKQRGCSSRQGCSRARTSRGTCCNRRHAKGQVRVRDILTIVIVPLRLS